MLTLKDRIDAIRETKIEHTLKKREQNGYTDLDDFGTVPISEGYSVEPLYNSTNGSFYGYDGMCENFVRVINAHVPYVDKNEMLCGRWRDMLVNYRGDLHYMPDWLKNNLKNLEFIKNGATNQWSKRWDEQRFPYDYLKPLQAKYNITTGIDGDAHFACDYKIGFELGFGGLLEKVIEDHLGVGVLLQLDDDTHTDTVGFVTEIGDTFQPLVADLLSDLADQLALVHLVGQLGDDDADPVLAEFLELGTGTNHHLAAAGGVGGTDTAAAHNNTAGGEVGSLYMLTKFS